MKAWWQQLNSREQRLVAAMGLAFMVFIFYSAIWQPLNNSLTEANSKLVRQQQLLSWVQENTALYQQAKRSSGKLNLSGSISSVANRSAKNYKLTITRMQPQGDDLQVWIDSTPFTQLLFWLEHLANNEGLKVKAIDLSQGDNTGEVKVRRLHLARL
ncbi:type II secretion system protein GspM [Colwellia psychrerythraea]|uniref:Type II secretion system protein M n=1 Tax=Colwellia psychrerythraea TaxID=28229 RepID=A0A099KQ73_COLPS|nr:type II secretion system protein M [Colwellia psychrerythraea]KGJ92380.1 General secretion pathway M protein [Colwellia psychrerythraea]